MWSFSDAIQVEHPVTLRHYAGERVKNDMMVCETVYKILLLDDPMCNMWCTNLMNGSNFNMFIYIYIYIYIYIIIIIIIIINKHI